MPASATGGSAASQKRVHSRSPYRDALEMMLARPERQAAPPESAVEISRNAKGVAQFTVTVRGLDVWECFESAQTCFDHLVSLHPYPVEGAGSPQTLGVAPEPIQEPAEPPTRPRRRSRAS